MDTNSILLYAIGAFLLQTVFLIWIISTATATKKRLSQADIQNRLLILISKKLNATQEEIDAAIEA